MVRNPHALRRELLAQSSDLIELAPGWSVSKWAEVVITDRSGELPRVIARAAIEGTASHPRAVIEWVKAEGVKGPVRASQVAALGRLMPDLPALVLSMAWIRFNQDERETASPEAFSKALRSAGNRTKRGLIESEDRALHLWETKYQPSGMTQREAAERLRLAYPTFRTYLSHARARRGN